MASWFWTIPLLDQSLFGACLLCLVLYPSHEVILLAPKPTETIFLLEILSDFPLLTRPCATQDQPDLPHAALPCFPPHPALTTYPNIQLAATLHSCFSLNTTFLYLCVSCYVFSQLSFHALPTACKTYPPEPCQKSILTEDLSVPPTPSQTWPPQESPAVLTCCGVLGRWCDAAVMNV